MSFPPQSKLRKDIILIVIGGNDTMDSPLFEIKNLTKKYSNPLFSKNNHEITALDNISFTIKKNEIFGLVGESGCGKSTLGRNIIMMDAPTSGTIAYNGVLVKDMKPDQLLQFKRKMQIIYQDSYASFNPKMTIKRIIEEPLLICKTMPEMQRNAIINTVISKVGLHENHLYKLPHELSGGQKQRVGIARAISANAEFIVCDEPVSALDVSIQGQILNMLKDLKEEYHLTYLFIGHNLPVIYNMADRVAVMFKGNIVEIGETKSVFSSMAHPYTKDLFAAIPSQNNTGFSIMNRQVKQSSIVPAADRCVYYERCRFRTDTCLKKGKPLLRSLSETHMAACHNI